MTARRRLATTVGRLGLAAAAVVALTGCERPAPIVTVVSGSTSEWKEADVFCFEGQSPEAGDCAQRSTETPRIPVTPGERVGVDVGKEVRERGWFVALSGPAGQGEAQESDVQVDQAYFSFTAPNVGPDGLRLTVRTLPEENARGEASGEWTFDLVPRP
jgi:hypothetical protein